MDRAWSNTLSEWSYLKTSSPCPWTAPDPLTESCRGVLNPNNESQKRPLPKVSCISGYPCGESRKVLFEVFSGLIFKAHPRSRPNSPNGTSLEIWPVEFCIKEYEFLTFRYILIGAILVLIPKKLFYWENVLRNPQVGLLIGLKKRCEYVRFTAQISRDLSWLK